jgi:hypothetical protein
VADYLKLNYGCPEFLNPSAQLSEYSETCHELPDHPSVSAH